MTPGWAEGAGSAWLLLRLSSSPRRGLGCGQPHIKAKGSLPPPQEEQFGPLPTHLRKDSPPSTSFLSRRP